MTFRVVAMPLAMISLSGDLEPRGGFRTVTEVSVIMVQSLVGGGLRVTVAQSQK